LPAGARSLPARREASPVLRRSPCKAPNKSANWAMVYFAVQQACRSNPAGLLCCDTRPRGGLCRAAIRPTAAYGTATQKRTSRLSFWPAGWYDKQNRAGKAGKTNSNRPGVIPMPAKNRAASVQAPI